MGESKPAAEVSKTQEAVKPEADEVVHQQAEKAASEPVAVKAEAQPASAPVTEKPAAKNNTPQSRPGKTRRSQGTTFQSAYRGFGRISSAVDSLEKSKNR